MFSFKLIIFAICLKTIHSQEGNYCRTPLGDPGICILITRCEGLVTLIKTQGYNEELLNYLRRATCGYRSTTPLTCCAQISSQFRTTTNHPQTPPPIQTVPPKRPTGSGIITGPPSGTGGSTVLGGGSQNGNNNGNNGNTGIPTNTGSTVLGGNNGRDNPEPIPEIIDNNNPGTTQGVLQPPYCGRSNDTNTRIVGGVPAKLGEFPWMVALGYRNKQNPSQPKWLCGGTLITQTQILTAGHCAYNRPDLYLARVGELDLYSSDDGASPQDIPLLKVKIHENYSATSYTNDIAIVTLQSPPTIPGVWPICLPFNDDLRTKTFERDNLIVAGWGALYFNGPSSPTLLKAFLPVVNNQKCKDAFTSFKTTIIDDRVMCAGRTNGAQDACQGDSGGPLMKAQQNSNGRTYYQVGIVSYGFKCAEIGYPGVYTRVTSFLDWISANIN